MANAIRGFNALTPGGALPRPDVLIVARGGGSIEDLWGFNEEIVVRAAAESAIPLISAVGHETDTTLIDHAADRRAPTPTAAAEMAVPVRLDLMAWVDGQEARLSRALTQGVGQRRQRLGDLSRLLPRPEALLSDPRQRLDRAEEALKSGLLRLVDRRGADLARMAGALRPAVLSGRLRTETGRLAERARRLAPALDRGVTRRGEALHTLVARLRPEPIRDRITRQAADLVRLDQRLDSAMSSRLTGLTDRLHSLDRMRQTLGYKETLERGYAVVRAGDAVVTEAKAARAAGALEIEFRDGRVEAHAGGGGGRGRAKPKPPEQGSLF